MATATKLLTALSLLVTGAFGLLLALALLVPIYTDEIGSKVQLMRALVEGGRLVMPLPQCASAYSIPIPLSWYPAAAYYHVFFLPLGLLGHKVSGLVVALGWFSLLACAVARTTRDCGARVRRFGGVVALHAAGTLPLALVTGRAEPFLIVLLGAFIALPVAWPIAQRRSWWGRALTTLVFIVVTSIFYDSHFKSLLFTPFVLVSAVVTFRKRAAHMAAAVAFVILAAFQTHGVVKRFSQCSAAPSVGAFLQNLTLDPAMAVADPGRFAAEGAKNLHGRVIDIANSVTIVAPHPWLPPSTVVDAPALVTRVDGVSRVLLYALFVGVPIFVVLVGLRTWSAPHARRPFVLAATLLVCLLGHLILARHWAFYMTPFAVGVVALVAFVAAAGVGGALSREDKARVARLVLIGSLVFQAAALISMAMTLAHVGPRLFALQRVEGTLLPGQPAHVPAFGFAKERTKIREHAARCGISGDGARRLVVDDATYFAFDDLREPVHLIYVSDATMWGVDIPGEKNVALFRELGVSGIISRCSYFPTALEHKATRAGGYCCVSADELR
ncbi:MAG: hypothetical protein KF764_06285 [Labilithrix sp.]|nr:hypothetical protein [Labilithrix sp.]